MKRFVMILFAVLMTLGTCGLLQAKSVKSESPQPDAFQGILPVTDRTMMKSLNGEWQLKVVDGVTNDKSVPKADASWRAIPVPGCWEIYGFSKPRYDSPNRLTGYYRTQFSVPQAWKGMRTVIRLDGVLYGYDLWVNDRYVGTWLSGYNTALFDITPYVNPKSDRQELALRVFSQSPEADFDYNDDWAPCGIIRDVTLMGIPQTHLADLTIDARLSGEVKVKTEIAGGGKNTQVSHEILDAQGRVVGTNHVNSPRLWTAETPYLYTLRTKLTEKGRTLQTFEHRFGFREVTIDGNVLKLNGRPIKLRGVTSHATDPRTGKVISDSLTLRDMQLMKAASVNYIRTSHYPREPRFYELADSLGFYIIDEVPFGYGDAHLSDSAYYPVLERRAQATIRRDKNHPSVLIWSLGNENPLTDICIRLGDHVKRNLDPTRPICYPQEGYYFVRYNYDFPKVADLYTPHYPSTAQIADFYQRADRPVIFTEYCHTLGISLEDHDRQWELIERTPCIAGGSVWEWVDQAMPFSEPLRDSYGYEERVFTSHDGGYQMYGNKGTDGLLYADRTPLPNYFELQHNYARAAVTDSILKMDADGGLTLHIRNRYDFLNLKDHVSFNWSLQADRDTLARGAFSPDCQPHESTTYQLHPNVYVPLADKVLLLNVDVCDAQGHTFLHQSIPVGSVDLIQRLLNGLAPTNEVPTSLMQEGLLVRAGRKSTLAEKMRPGDKRLERYLMRLPAMNADIQSEQVGSATHYSFTLRPDSTNTFLPELGIAMLLAPEIDRVQWIGQGEVPTYPGRFRAARYGFWALQQGDLYFEGNHRGVDAALLTDKEGNGLLIFCRNGNISFEQTDRGIVLTCNVAVAGQGPKFSRTAFPVFARNVGTVAGDFYLYRTEADKMPELLRQLFLNPSAIPAPRRPYVTQYDTYLMRYADIIQE